VLNALERVSPFVVSGDDPVQPRHDLKRTWDAVAKRAGLTGVLVGGWVCRSLVGC
jgi:hypothetical protein